MQNLIQEWLKAKADEAAAVERRRAAEDRLTEELNVRMVEAVQTFNHGEYVIKATPRFNRKIDAEMLRELDPPEGLFRWKPELNMAAWRAADESITRPLLGAITTEPGRISYKIMEKTNETQSDI